MYGVPEELDLSPAVGEFTTQIRVGQFDLQFTLGPVDFVLQSSVHLHRNGEVIGAWEQGKWPDEQFFDVMNVKLVKFTVPNDRVIVLYFENGIEMHLKDDSDHYESMQISISGDPLPWII